MMILVVGRPDSGKSAKAEELVTEMSASDKRIYLATMIPYGEEGKERVIKHRTMREGKGFVTVERPKDVGTLPDANGLIEGIAASKATVLLECVSNLCANVMFERTDKKQDKLLSDKTAEVVIKDILMLKDKVKNLVVVTNEFEQEEGFDEDTIRYTQAVSVVNAALKNAADKTYDLIKGTI